MHGFFDLRDIHRSILCLRRETVNTAIFSERQVEVPDAARPAGGIRLPRTAGSVIASLSAPACQVLSVALCGSLCPLWLNRTADYPTPESRPMLWDVTC
jgi:hypothetical protein